jgi:hypothetical protein
MYFKSAEFKATGQALTYAGYEEWQEKMVTSNPQFEISADWYNTAEHCYTYSPVIIPTDSSNDSSTFPFLAQDDPNGIYHLFTSVTIELAPGQDTQLEGYKNYVEVKCKPQLITISSDANEVAGMPGLARDQFVSATGELPGRLKRGNAIAAGIFFAGVIHSYWVTAVPIVTAHIEKKAVTLGSYSFPLGCFSIHNVCNTF